MNKLGKRKKPSPSTAQPAAEASTVDKMADKRPMELEAGWSLMRVQNAPQIMKAHHQRECTEQYFALQRGIDKLKKLLENEPEESFTAQEYMTLYT